MTPKEFAALNERRIELIEKEFSAEGITKEEKEEYERITKECSVYINEKHPLPFEYLTELIEEARRRTGG